MNRGYLGFTPLRLSLFASILFSIVLVGALLSQAPARGKNYAFMVACGEYDNDKEFGKLPFTIKELLEFKDVLVASGDYKEADIKLLHNELKDKRFQPRRKRIIEELDILLNRLNEEDSLMVVFNGHGIQPKDDPAAYFCPIDATVDDKKSCIPLEGKEGIFERLKETKLKRKLLIVNACRDDPGSKPTMAARKKDLFDKQHKYESPTGIAALFSCQAGQFSYYYPDEKETKGLQRSLFFHHLIESWQGKYSTGKDISLEDVFREVKDRTAIEADKLFGDSQVPFMKREYEKEWTIRRVDVARLPEMKNRDGASEKFIVSKTFSNMKLIRIPAGTFTMGSPENEKERMDNETQHEVTLTKDYYMGEYTVTVGQWKVFQKDMDYDANAGKKPSFEQDDDHPVVNVSHDDAKAFCEWLSKKDGRKYRLPTEAEWEYACRARTKTAYSFGDDISKNDANIDGNGTKKVGSYKPNAFGLYDMHGNVWQWCSDKYGDYPSGSVTDPTGSSDGSFRVYRGGSWYAKPDDCRSAGRSRRTPGNRGSFLGFRVSGSVGE